MTTCLSGRVGMHIDLTLRFDYGRTVPWVSRMEGGTLRAIAGPHMVQLHTDTETRGRGRSTIGEFTLAEGESRSFVMTYESQELDASLLLMPLVGFLPATDRRIRATVAAIEKTLSVDGLLLRYNTGTAEDALSPGEGVFLACNFWLADNFVLQGRYDEARALFERLISLRNDVGLLAEEYDPKASACSAISLRPSRTWH